MKKKILLALVLALAILAVGVSTFGGTVFASSNSGVYPPDAIVSGKTYGEWSAAWWQWIFAIPISSNPGYDSTGQHCNVQQTRPVFFLAGTFTGETVTRECTVPSDTPLFFPLATAECSDVEAPPFYGATDAERVACAKGWADLIDADTLKATIDGVDVHGLGRFRVASPPFAFKEPAQNNIFFLPGVTSGHSASDGYWLMVKPLSPGNHTLHFEAPDYSQNVTYNLTVMP